MDGTAGVEGWSRCGRPPGSSASPGTCSTGPPRGRARSSTSVLAPGAALGRRGVARAHQAGPARGGMTPDLASDLARLCRVAPSAPVDRPELLLAFTRGLLSRGSITPAALRERLAAAGVSDRAVKKAAAATCAPAPVPAPWWRRRVPGACAGVPAPPCRDRVVPMTEPRRRAPRAPPGRGARGPPVPLQLVAECERAGADPVRDAATGLAPAASPDRHPAGALEDARAVLQEPSVEAATVRR